MVQPIDFADLFRRQLQSMRERQGGNGPSTPPTPPTGTAS